MRKLKIRKLVEADMSTIDQYRASTKFQKVFPVDTKSDEYLDEMERCKKSISDTNPNRFDFAITLENSVIGYAIIKVNKSDWEIGYELNPEYWNRGLGHSVADLVVQYSFNELDLETIIAQCATTNVRSNKILKRLEMTKTETVDINSDLSVNKYSLTKAHYKTLGKINKGLH